MPKIAGVNARDRLLIAGADLLSAAGGGDVSTRDICERAGVQAPTLYHHFGSKQALLDEVVSHGFRQFLADRNAQAGDDDDPIAAVREAWDIHVRFGVENPAFYAHIYARAEVGQRCGVVTEVEAMILATLEPAARRGRLSVSAADAAAEILAASSGVVLHLIGTPGDQVDWALSARVRNAILAAVTVSTPDSAGPTVASVAITLAARLDEAGPALSPEETALLRIWLDRLTHATTLPEVITRYLRAHAPRPDGSRDVPTAAATFTDDATVTDDGRTYHGKSEVEAWIGSAAAEFSYTTKPIRQEKIDDRTYLVVNHVVGDFPGGVVDLAYRFTVRDGLISELTIMPVSP